MRRDAARTYRSRARGATIGIQRGDPLLGMATGAQCGDRCAVLRPVRSAAIVAQHADR